MYVSRSLIIRFSRDMAQLYTDLLGLGEAVDSGALFSASQRLVETVTACSKSTPTQTVGPDETSVSARTAEVLATTVLIRLKDLDERGLLLRPGRRRRLYGLALSMLRAVCDSEARLPPHQTSLQKAPAQAPAHSPGHTHHHARHRAGPETADRNTFPPGVDNVPIGV